MRIAADVHRSRTWDHTCGEHIWFYSTFTPSHPHLIVCSCQCLGLFIILCKVTRSRLMWQQQYLHWQAHRGHEALTHEAVCARTRVVHISQSPRPPAPLPIWTDLGILGIAVLLCSSKSYFHTNLVLTRIYLWARPIKINLSQVKLA